MLRYHADANQLGNAPFEKLLADVCYRDSCTPLLSISQPGSDDVQCGQLSRRVYQAEGILCGERTRWRPLPW